VRLALVFAGDIFGERNSGRIVGYGFGCVSSGSGFLLSCACFWRHSGVLY